MMPSRRDSNRTPADMMKLLAKKALRDGLIEDEFAATFNPKYQDLARRIYQEAKQ
jgi:hypothetical protein